MSYICEKCGKLVTQKFGSGRFCSRACANSRTHSFESIQKIKNAFKDGRYDNVYIGTCAYCGKQFTYYKIVNGKISKRKTCSKECLLKLKSKNALNNKGGGYREGSAKNYIYGIYQNIECDSSWELAVVVYCLENNIQIQRNKKPFKYIYKNKEYNYYPDFIINDEYVEVKNYITDKVKAKQEYFPKNLKYRIISKNEIQFYINYCTEKYGINFPEILYDKTKRNYLQK